MDGCFDIIGQDKWVCETEKYYLMVIFRGGILSMSMTEREMELKENLKPVGRGEQMSECTLEDIMHGFGWTCDEDQIWDN